MLAAAPIGNLGRYIQESRVIRAIDDRLPPSPPVIARIARFLDPLGFPRAFAGLEPDPGPPVALPGTSALQTAIDAASPSTLKIEATGYRPRFTLDDGIRELIKGYRMLKRSPLKNA
jgi:nucleoside-diphosphate-sugar epimerase